MLMEEMSILRMEPQSCRTIFAATSADLVRNNGFPIFFKLPYKVYNIHSKLH